MEIQLSWTMATVLIAIIVNTAIVIYNAGKTSGLINHLHECIHRLDKALEKRDEAIGRAHERIDALQNK